MATVTCAISGLKLHIPHMPMTLSHKEGYYHPVFLLKQRHLWNLYRKHCEGGLTQTDSYLLFLALLHSTKHVSWGLPTTLNPDDSDTCRFLESNMKQLVDVIQLTNTITIPSFTQPSFIVTLDNSNLSQIPNWIAAWNKNVDVFKTGRAGAKFQDSLQKTENRLSYFIKSGIAPQQYAHVVASWANKAAQFPKKDAEAWCKIIRACFNSVKMFSTKLSDLREIKSYCETNITSGSIHTHALYNVLREGISRHTDYLGMNPVALGYTLLDADTSKNDEKVAALIATAPTTEPTPAVYPDFLQYLKAKSAWMASKYASGKEIPELEPTEVVEVVDSEELEEAELGDYDPSNNSPVRDI